MRQLEKLQRWLARYRVRRSIPRREHDLTDEGWARLRQMWLAAGGSLQEWESLSDRSLEF